MIEFFHHYAEILSDPAHTAVEFTFVLFDVLVIDFVRRRIIRHLHRDVIGHTHAAGPVASDPSKGGYL